MATSAASLLGCGANLHRGTIWNPFGLDVPFAPTQDPVRVGIEVQSTGLLEPQRWAALFRLAPWDALGRRMMRELDAPVQFEPMTADQIAYHLESGRLQFALTSRAGYQTIHDLGADCRQIAVAVAARRQTMIVACAASGIRTLPELRGKRFAIGWPQDAHLDAAAFRCLEEGGVSPDELQRELLPVPGLRQRHADSASAARQIAYGLGTPAGAIDAAYYDALPVRGGRWAVVGATVSKDQFVVLARAHPVYVETIDDGRFLASAGTAPDLVQRTEHVLATLHQSDAPALAALGLERFRVPGGTAAVQRTR